MADADPDDDSGGGGLVLPLKRSQLPLPKVRGMLNIGNVLTGDEATSMMSTAPVKLPMPIVPKCGDYECLNGPPVLIDPLTSAETVFETYATCAICTKLAPDPYFYGHVIMPAEWKRANRSAADVAAERKKRRLKSVAVFSANVYGQCVRAYPEIYGQDVA
jgi:hypothetical protein